MKAEGLPTVAELLRGFGRRSISPVEVTRSLLEAIERDNPRLHAYVDVYAEAALLRAKASEQRYACGLPVGLLEGVPLAVKDLLHIEGRRTSAGSTIHAGRAPATTTATVVSRLLAQGAIPLGKANLVEFAFGGWGTNQGCMTPRNPWDGRTHRSPGGSSSGSAVAVAGGLAAAAIGTDTGGSVRIPAAFCGLTGLKTTQGRISNHGCELVSHTLDTVGPLAWTAEDAALLLQAIHGPDPADPATLQQPPENFLARLREPIGGTRIAVAPRGMLEEVEDDIWASTSDAVRVLLDLGCLRNDAAFERIDFVADQAETGIIIASEAYAFHGALLQGDPVPGDPAARARVLAGASISASRYANAIRFREQRRREFSRVFEAVDLLVLPTLPITARDVGRIDEKDLAPSRLTRFVGYYGLCAIAQPAGLSADGLPVSVQLVAPAFREALLLRAGAAFQSVTGHHALRPIHTHSK